MADDEGFVRRWARRKSAAREQARAAASEPAQGPEPEGADAAPAPAPAEAPARRDPEPAVDLDSLPDIESLTYESDYTVFLRKGVPAELRRQALRKLWRSDPILANLDGLVDYADDYADPSLVRPGIETLYRVGQGLLRKPEEASVQEPDHEPVIAHPPAVEDRTEPSASAGEKTGAKVHRRGRGQTETA
jgi:Protein of unknown function (DUF3306)